MAGRELIDGLRSPDGSLALAAIRRILPYGDDFLFVHGASVLDETRIEAFFQVPDRAPWLQAHFVDLPIMPGVLVGEGLAQAGTLVVRYNLEDPDGHHILAYQIETARFTAPAVPGDRLTFEVELKNLSRRAARLEGTVRIAQREICRARVVVGIVAADDLRRRIGEQRA
jgi:3-hydroxyacyl-[acyl-carrier-protein] dehydratase